MEEATRIAYALPAVATDEVRAYLRTRSEGELAAVGAARLPVARVLGAGTVLAGDGSSLASDGSGDFGGAEGRPWLLDAGDLRCPVTLDGPVAVAAVNLGAGYCHWLLEELPRLLGVPLGEAEHVIVHAGPGYARAALARRGGKERLVEPRRNSHFACAPLLVPALVGRAGWPTPTALARVEAFTEGLGRTEPGRGERLYFSRSRAGRRRVNNEEELWAELATRGFNRVWLEELSWPEQIAACRRARVVVAAHGAGLANLVFCPPGTRVVELVNRTYFNPTFWRLASLRGLDYRPVVTAGEEPLGADRKANRRDIEADLAGVRRALSE
ncbi:MAG: glycosyltransferase family 61 protein [Verrucomicrobia bacterium]|nr:glycosyltransferase family 61 protein [Verrucomicrobiota bacterium]